MEQLQSLWPLLSISFVIAGSVWSMAWWLNGHFNLIRKEVVALGKEIIEKLQYHERHDDERFSQIHTALTDIRVRNAATDALMVVMERNKEDKR